MEYDIIIHGKVTTKEKDKFYLQLFDEDIFEQKIEIPEMKDLSKKDLQIRLNKKIKLFL